MKTATTIDEQIQRLRNRGMIISDEHKAREVLSDIGYYRLGFYWFPFELRYPNRHHRDHIFRPNSNFEDALTLYYFDQDLRKALTPMLHRVEIHLRTTIVYVISNYYRENPTWFSDPKIVTSTFLEKLPALYADVRKNYTIKIHHRNYRNDIYAPAWKTIEYITFGSLLFLFENLKSEPLKCRIAESMGVKNLKAFQSHMQTLRELRNVCAHGHNLFDLRLSRPITPGEIQIYSPAERSNVTGAIKVLAYTLSHISQSRSNELQGNVTKLVHELENSAVYYLISHIKI